MTIQVVLLAGIVVLGACGVYLLLERSVTRIILGVLLLGNMANLTMFVMSGSFGTTPIYESGMEVTAASDPLPQAFILTAIVISFATCAFMLALLYRSWRIAHEEAVADDEEDVALRSNDPQADDETFTETDCGDTEFGSTAAHPVVDAGHAFGAGRSDNEPLPDTGSLDLAVRPDSVSQSTPNQSAPNQSAPAESTSDEPEEPNA